MTVLPAGARQCTDLLEQAGFEAWAVGGCVRDALLGLTPQDYDLCTSATPAQMKDLFSAFSLVLAGEKHGTVGVITATGVVEITTFRREGAYPDRRHPDRVDFVTDIRQDLSRRDFTVNAMAWSEKRGLMDPFGGQQDLKNKVLRTVGDPEVRFQEDALRILRGVRFAVRYHLTPENATREAMLRLTPLMDTLARERVFDELCKLLPTLEAADLLQFAPVITAVLPELAPTVDFDQHSPHHAFDVYTHTAFVTAGVPKDLPLRWAALLHDAGKPPCFTRDETGRGHFYGHAEESARLAQQALLRLKAPTRLRQEVDFLIRHHMTPLAPDRALLRRRVSKWGMENVRALLSLQEADFSSKGVTGENMDFDGIRQILSDIRQENACLTLRDLAVSGNDLMILGLQGPAIGRALNALLAQVVEERLPNERHSLLAAARDML